MPELPEVETIRRQIESTLLHAQLHTVQMHRSNIVRGDITKLIGGTIQSVDRFGKLLIVHFSNAHSLTVHLKMTGRLTLLADPVESPPHTHVLFQLQKDAKTIFVAFSDARRFGFLHILLTNDVCNISFLQHLGKEPLKDLQFTHFEQLLNKSNRPIKSLLLDQTRIAGIGNIYACEAAWMARIHPLQTARSLPKKKKKDLFRAIEEVLQEGIERGGASDNTYRDLTGGKGQYQNFFKVYGQEGKPCLRCETQIIRTVIGGRGTWHCPTCQKHSV